MTTALIALLNADLAQEAKATPNVKAWADEGDRYSVCTASEEGANHQCVASFMYKNENVDNDLKEFMTARNHHKPYVVALLKIAEAENQFEHGPASIFEYHRAIRAALAELAEALGVQE